MTIASAMIRPLSPDRQAAAQLVVCPFAGASLSAFRSWRDCTMPGLDLALAVYPGRDSRIHAPCVDRIEHLALELRDALLTHTDRNRPLVLAGHSMGAQVAFETCALLERSGAPPTLLVLSGCHAPHLRGRRPLSNLDDAAFLAGLARIGGCGEAARAEPALLTAFLPMLRADFRATEAYFRAPPNVTVRCPTLLVCGSQDEEASYDEVAAWREWLRNAANPVTIAGDHFYLTRRPRAFLTHVLRRLDTMFPDPEGKMP